MTKLFTGFGSVRIVRTPQPLNNTCVLGSWWNYLPLGYELGHTEEVEYFQPCLYGSGKAFGSCPNSYTL